MTVYYNEWDAYAAQWLRNLIAAGHLPAGDVDERDIRDVAPEDLDGYEQVHFFAGIGGWPLALELAGWEGPVWTGSCPCQPFSSAGQSRGLGDERHLWPTFQRLIAECKPSVVFGEQVAGTDGRRWVAGIRCDLERMGYAVGAADLCAAGVGAPHIRQRLFWVAHASSERRQQDAGSAPGDESAHGRRSEGNNEPASYGADGGLAHDDSAGRGRLEDAGIQRTELHDVDGRGANGGMVHAAIRGRPGANGTGEQQHGPGPGCFWRDFDLIPCRDGKARRVEPGTFPLAHGVSGRVGQLRAYGNAIVPQVAAEFVKAYAGLHDRL